jgi:hypothetical protein
MRGEIVYLYSFDVANEIATADIQEVLSNKSAPLEIRTDHTIPRDVPLYKPLSIEPQHQAHSSGKPLRIVVRVFDVGVINVLMRVPFEVASLAELHEHHRPKLDSGETFDKLALQMCRQVCQSIERHLKRPSIASDPEAYTVFCLTDLDGQRDANVWFAEHRRDVAGLLAETSPKLLSEAQVDESLRITRSFANTDLAVIDWDACLMIELDDYAEDVVYALELANLQLEEFRVMDRRLDQHLDRVYRDLERPRRSLVGSPTKVLNSLRRFRVDATKLTDEVTHITKFWGDWHLARVYLGAAERFHLKEWQQSVAQRLSQVDEVYSVLQSEVYERRMLWLEIAVVICFIVDLLAIFLWKH